MINFENHHASEAQTARKDMLEAAKGLKKMMKHIEMRSLNPEHEFYGTIEAQLDMVAEMSKLYLSAWSSYKDSTGNSDPTLHVQRF